MAYVEEAMGLANRGVMLSRLSLMAKLISLKIENITQKTI